MIAFGTAARVPVDQLGQIQLVDHFKRCSVPDGLPAAIHQPTVAEYIVGIGRIG